MSSTRSYTPPKSLVPFFLSEKTISLVVGPYGSTKTTAGVMKIAYHAKRMAPCADGIRRSRAVWVRNTRQTLLDTSIPDFLKWFPDGVAGTFYKTELKFILRFDDVECEILFRGLEDANDVRRLLSLQVSFAIFDEFREIHQDIYENMQPRLGRYPDKDMVKPRPEWGVDHKGDPIGGCVREDGQPNKLLWGMSNPPDLDTFWEGVLTDPPDNVHVTIQPSGLSPEADWIQYLPTDYYEDLMKGKSQDWIDVCVHAKFGKSLAGRPVYASTFNGDFHVAKTPFIPLKDSSKPIVIGLDFGRCYDDQTEVLTETGWKFFRDVADTERVATLNPDTFTLEYTDINFKVEYDYVGEMLEWAGPNINFCVTPEHRTPYTRRDTPETLRWASADELADQMAAHRYIQVTARHWQGEIPTNLPLDMAPSDFAEFMGWWMSDGCIEKGTNRIYIAQKKPAPSLNQLVERLAIYGIRAHSLDNGFRFSNAALAAYLRILGAKHTGVRRVPECIMRAPREIIERFVMAYTYGDGHIRERNGSTEHTIWFNNADLAGQFQELALKLGWSSAVRVATGGTSRFADGRKVTCSGGWSVSFKKSWERVELLPGQFQRKQYSGKIYCLNVPYHTLYVRRNGKVCWNGNTPAAVFFQRNVYGQVVCLGELTSENMGIDTFLNTKLKPFLVEHFVGCTFVVAPDPAGWHKQQIGEISPVDVIKRAGLRCVKPATNDPERRIQAVERLLTGNAGGKALLVINPECKVLIQGFRSGYRYKLKRDGIAETTPHKNEFSHVHDSCQYASLVIEGNVLGGQYGSQRREVTHVHAGGWT